MKGLILAIIALPLIAVAFFAGTQFLNVTEMQPEPIVEISSTVAAEENLPEPEPEPEPAPQAQATPEPAPEEAQSEQDALKELFGDATYAIGCLGYDWQMPAEHPDYDFIGMAGDEYYYIVPLEQDSAIAIYEDEMEGQMTLVYASAQARPMVVRGNQSDIFANMYITLTAPDGAVTEIRPFISLKDGSVEIGDNAVLLPAASMPKSALE